MTNAELEALWQTYGDAGSPGGYFESEERTLADLHTAIKYAGWEKEWYDEAFAYLWRLLHPDQISFPCPGGDVENHPIIHAIAERLKERPGCRAR